MTRAVLVPCKNFDQGKSRLSVCMDPRHRRVLCELFLDRTLGIVSQVAEKSSVRVVTADPEASEVARRHGVLVMPDEDAALNAALASARTRLLEAQRDDDGLELMIVPIDLPLATPASLMHVLDTPGDMVIVPDELGTGTNVLLLRARAARELTLSFGPDSFQRHCADAARLGASVEVVRDTLLSFDVDYPVQYARWLAMPGAQRVEGLEPRQAGPVA